MKGIGLLLAVGAGLAILGAASSSKAEPKPSEPGPTPPFPPEVEPPGGGAMPSTAPAKSAFELCVDDGMPAPLRLEAEKAFASKTLAPKDYEDLAAIYEDAGYPLMAKCLSDLGKAKEATLKAEVARRGGMPHVIRAGDIPSLMATYYTGTASRFKELGPLNPQIGSLKTVNGVTNYTKWNVGTEILIPAAWNPLDKPVPPVARKGPSDAEIEAQKAKEDAKKAAEQPKEVADGSPTIIEEWFAKK